MQCDPFAESGSDVTTAVDVDLWELNHVHCLETGDETLTQVVLWSFEPWTLPPAYHVVAWALTKDCVPAYKDGDRWLGQVKGRWVSARVRIETRTYYDTELADRNKWPDDRRRGLR